MLCSVCLDQSISECGISTFKHLVAGTNEHSNDSVQLHHQHNYVIVCVRIVLKLFSPGYNGSLIEAFLLDHS